MYSVLPPIGMLSLRGNAINDDMMPLMGNGTAKTSDSAPERLSLARPCRDDNDEIPNTKSRVGGNELILSDEQSSIGNLKSFHAEQNVNVDYFYEQGNFQTKDVSFGSRDMDNTNQKSNIGMTESPSPTTGSCSPRLKRPTSVSSQKYSFEDQLTFAPKLNAFSLKLAQSRTSVTRRIKVGCESRAAALQEEMSQNFTFKPSISENSCKIAERLKTDFWERQRQHTEKQKKLVDSAPSTWHPKAKASQHIITRQNVSNTDDVSGKTQARKISLSVSDQALHTEAKPTQPSIVHNFQESYAKSMEALVLKRGKFKQNMSTLKSESLRPKAIHKLENRREKGTEKICESVSCDAEEDLNNDLHRTVLPDNGEKHKRTRSNPLHHTSPPNVKPQDGRIIHRRSRTMPVSSNKTHRSTTTTIDPDRFFRTRHAAELALKNKKVFICIGPYPTLRQSLRRRGWVEKYFKADITYKMTSKRRKDDSDNDWDDNNEDDDDNDVGENRGNENTQNNINNNTSNKTECTLSDGTKMAETEEGSTMKSDRSRHLETIVSVTDEKGIGKVDTSKVDDETGNLMKQSLDDGFESDGQYGIMSRIARNAVPSLIWTCKRDDIDFKFLRKDQIVNHFAKAVSFTTKFGLCVNLRNLPWFEPMESQAFFPRCHRLSSDTERLDFIDDYRMTSAMSILKWVVFRHGESQDGENENDENLESVRTESNKKKNRALISSRVLILAMRACQGFLKSKDHVDIEEANGGETCSLSEESWSQVLDHFYQVVHGGATIVNAVVYVEECKKLLNRMKDHFPQMDIDGLQNIWIIKPGAKSRGRGIIIMDRLDEILRLVSNNVVKKENRWVVQKYIERPLLIYNTKFDIRQWFLVTDWNPLTLWFYQVCYLRFCSQEYTLDKFDPQYHLANNSIQKRYENGTRSGLLPDDNMWSSEEFQQYLKDRGHGDVWNDLIYPGMKQSITYALESCQDSLEYRKNSFELYGADFMLSEDMKPWLIEINCSPAMGASTAITERLCSQVIDDTLKAVIDRKENRNCETGHFELTYKQPHIAVPAYIGNNLVVEGEGYKKTAISNVLNQQCSNPKLVRLPKPKEVKQVSTGNEQPQAPKTAPEKLWKQESIPICSQEDAIEGKVEIKLSEAFAKELNYKSPIRRGSWSGCLCGKGKKCKTASGYQLKSAQIEIPFTNFQHFSPRTILDRAKIDNFTVAPRLAKHVLRADKPKKRKKHVTKTLVRYQETTGRRLILSLGPGNGVKQM